MKKFRNCSLLAALFSLALSASAWEAPLVRVSAVSGDTVYTNGVTKAYVDAATNAAVVTASADATAKANAAQSAANAYAVTNATLAAIADLVLDTVSSANGVKYNSRYNSFVVGAKAGRKMTLKMSDPDGIYAGKALSVISNGYYGHTDCKGAFCVFDYVAATNAGITVAAKDYVLTSIWIYAYDANLNATNVTLTVTSKAPLVSRIEDLEGGE